MSESLISLVHEPSDDEPFIVVYKPKNLPSAPLKAGDDSAGTQVEKMFPPVKKIAGKKNIEHGLLHRIDNETDGLLLVAYTQNFYDWMTKVQSDGQFIKHYTAYCHPALCECDKTFPPLPFKKRPDNGPFKISSRFRFYGEKKSLVRPVTEDSSLIIQKKAEPVFYTTSVDSIENKDNYLKLSCSINRGFKHQVRCHLFWCGFCIYGDKKYSRLNDNCEMMFSATGLEFPLENGKNYKLNLEKLQFFESPQDWLNTE